MHIDIHNSDRDLAQSLPCAEEAKVSVLSDKIHTRMEFDSEVAFNEVCKFLRIYGVSFDYFTD